MLVDHRTYRIQPGTTQAHLEIYEQYGFAAQTRHLGQPLAYLFAESGDLNTLVHLWAYEDAPTDAPSRRHAGRSGMEDLSAGSANPATSRAEDLADDPGQVRPIKR